MAKIGFIGLGIMGAPMAGHLLDGGHEVTSCVHRTPAPEELTKKGLKLAKTAKEVAAASEIVITMVPDTPQVQAVGIDVTLVSKDRPLRIKASSEVLLAEEVDHHDLAAPGTQLHQ